MNFLCVSGSHQKNSQSHKVVGWLGAALEAKGQDMHADYVDLAGDPLPLWNADAWDDSSALAKRAQRFIDRAADADAFILVAPEWAGMAPAGLKNFLLYMSSKVCAHKPCLLVGVSAGRGGSYPIAELRMSGYKNNRLVYIPDHLIVQDVQNVMNASTTDENHGADQYIQKRANHSLDVLVAYAKALKEMRGANTLDHPDFPFGM